MAGRALTNENLLNLVQKIHHDLNKVFGFFIVEIMPGINLDKHIVFDQFMCTLCIFSGHCPHQKPVFTYAPIGLDQDGWTINLNQGFGMIKFLFQEAS